MNMYERNMQKIWGAGGNHWFGDEKYEPKEKPSIIYIKIKRDGVVTYITVQNLHLGSSVTFAGLCWSGTSATTWSG